MWSDITHKALNGMEIKMKLKYGIAALAFGAAACLSGWRGLCFGQTGCGIAAVLLLICACIMLFRLRKTQSDTVQKRSKFAAMMVVLATTATAAMPFVNGAVAARPAYTYQNYYCSGRMNANVFPEQIPPQAEEIHFRVLGEGMIGRPGFLLSFRMDTAAAADDLRQKAESLGEIVSDVTGTVHIPTDLAPDYFRGEGLLQCSVYQIKDQYGKVTFAIFHRTQPLVCYYQA